MSVDPKKHVFTGLVRPREHCTFTWEQPEGDPRRTAIVRENHCAQCVDALRERGYLLRSDAEAESR